MQPAQRTAEEAVPIDLMVGAREAVGDSQRTSTVDQVASEADQVAADADQRISDAFQTASDADQASAGIDQRASDRDQAVADRHHATTTDLTPADQLDYETARSERVRATITRQASQLKRARTASNRGTTAWKRDRIGHGNSTAAVAGRLVLIGGTKSGAVGCAVVGSGLSCLHPKSCRR